MLIEYLPAESTTASNEEWLTGFSVENLLDLSEAVLCIDTCQNYYFEIGKRRHSFEDMLQAREPLHTQLNPPKPRGALISME